MSVDWRFFIHPDVFFVVAWNSLERVFLIIRLFFYFSQGYDDDDGAAVTPFGSQERRAGSTPSLVRDGGLLAS